MPKTEKPQKNRASKYARATRHLCCPNQYCAFKADSDKGIHLHLIHNEQCFQFSIKQFAAHKQSTVMASNAKTTGLSDDESFKDNPWEPDDDNNDAVYLPIEDGSVTSGLIHVGDVTNATMAIVANLDVQPVFNITQHNNIIVGGQFNMLLLTDITRLQGIIQSRIELQNSTTAMNHNFAYTNSDLHEVGLLHLLNANNVPHGLFQQIQEWGKAAYLDKYEFNPKRLTRRAEIDYLEKWLNLSSFQPETVMCPLTSPTYQFVPVTRFDFTTQLMSLLSDALLVGDLNDLDVNPDDPFSKYISEDGFLTCFNSGAWYDKAYEYCIKLPNDFLCPIIFACDESKLKFGKTGCCPLMFTTTLFNQNMRNKSLVWRPLGYIYDLHNIESNFEKEHQTNDLKNTRLHEIFAKVLESFIIAQKTNVLDNVKLTLGSYSKVVNIKVPCAFIIGDMAGGDKICCSAAAYRENMKRPCRKCNVKGEELGDTEVKCKKISMVKMIRYVKEKQTNKLALFNQYCVHSAWFDVDFGGCRFGLFSAAMPIEPLHSLENGLMATCLKILFDEELGKVRCAKLDELAKKMTKWDRQHYLSSGAKKTMPTLLWKSGISTMSYTSAADKVGLLLTIIVLSLTDEGNNFFTSFLSLEDSCKNMQSCFQMMLCYWTWLKRKKFWKRGDTTARYAYKRSIREFLKVMQNLWPRLVKQGWRLAKFHEQLHVPDDIERNGAPCNTHSGPTEHNHIEFVKKPAQRTQKRLVNLDQQIAQRWKESMIIDLAQRAIQTLSNKNKGKHEKNTEIHPNQTSCKAGELTIYDFGNEDLRFYFEHDYKFAECLVEAETSISENVFLLASQRLRHLTTLAWKQKRDDVNEVTINYYSEYKRNGTIFRCNPNYRKEGGWHDWVMVRWLDDEARLTQPDIDTIPAIAFEDDTNNADFCYTPCKINGMFFKRPETESENEEHFAIVWPCKYKFKKSSIFTTQWELNFSDRNQMVPSYEMINCNTIVRHCCMIPFLLSDEANSKTYHEIWPRELWADEF